MTREEEQKQLLDYVSSVSFAGDIDRDKLSKKGKACLTEIETRLKYWEFFTKGYIVRYHGITPPNPFQVDKNH